MLTKVPNPGIGHHHAMLVAAVGLCKGPGLQLGAVICDRAFRKCGEKDIHRLRYLGSVVRMASIGSDIWLVGPQ